MTTKIGVAASEMSGIPKFPFVTKHFWKIQLHLVNMCSWPFISFANVRCSHAEKRWVFIHAQGTFLSYFRFVAVFFKLSSSLLWNTDMCMQTKLHILQEQIVLIPSLGNTLLAFSQFFLVFVWWSFAYNECMNVCKVYSMHFFIIICAVHSKNNAKCFSKMHLCFSVICYSNIFIQI